jgi:tRNA(Ile)-lysidine synthase
MPCALETAFATAWPPSAWGDVTSLAAVSGGPDSVAVLRAMVRLRTAGAAGRIVVAHYNHQWRGEESDGDEAFVKNLAASLRLECEMGHADQRTKSEEAARDERYAFLSATAHRVGARFVAVGHTADDQAETILFRMLRGTGLSGLTGMPQTRQLSEATTLIRPLLSVRRSDVMDYLDQLQQPYRTDGSNRDLRFARNRLRHEVLPALQELSAGDVVENLLQVGRQAAEIVEPLRRDAQRLLDQLVEFNDGAVLLHLDRLRDSPSRAVVREMFVELWRRRGWRRGEMTSARWEELSDAFASRLSPQRMFPGGLHVSVQGESLRIEGHCDPLPKR